MKTRIRHLSQRLSMVQGHVRDALDRRAGRPDPAISICAGEGRDLLGVLAGSPARVRRHGPTGRAGIRCWPPGPAARTYAGLTTVDVVTGDAARLDNYAGYLPASLVSDLRRLRQYQR